MSVKILDKLRVKSNVTRLIVKCNKMATIEELPDEIMMEIFLLMSIKEICRCAQVCQRLSSSHLFTIPESTMYELFSPNFLCFVFLKGIENKKCQYTCLA